MRSSIYSMSNFRVLATSAAGLRDNLCFCSFLLRKLGAPFTSLGPEDLSASSEPFGQATSAFVHLRCQRVLVRPVG